MQTAITVTNKVTVTLTENRTKLTAYVPAGMRGETLRNLYNKNAPRFAVAKQVLIFNSRG